VTVLQRRKLAKKKTKEKRRKQTLRGMVMGCMQPQGARGRGACGCKDMAAQQDKGERRAWGTGVKAQVRGERVVKAVPAAGRVWWCAHWETWCTQLRGGNAVTWLQKEVRKKKNNRENKKTYQIPAVPVLGVGVLTGLGNHTLTPTWAGYTWYLAR
jgi:hypothetical protein